MSVCMYNIDEIGNGVSYCNRSECAGNITGKPVTKNQIPRIIFKFAGTKNLRHLYFSNCILMTKLGKLKPINSTKSLEKPSPSTCT